MLDFAITECSFAVARLEVNFCRNAKTASNIATSPTQAKTREDHKPVSQYSFLNHSPCSNSNSKPISIPNTYSTPQTPHTRTKKHKKDVGWPTELFIFPPLRAGGKRNEGFLIYSGTIPDNTGIAIYLLRFKISQIRCRTFADVLVS